MCSFGAVGVLPTSSYNCSISLFCCVPIYHPFSCKMMKRLLDLKHLFILGQEFTYMETICVTIHISSVYDTDFNYK